MSGNGREALPDVRERSAAPRGCPGVVGRPSECQRLVRRPPPDDWEWSGGMHGWSGGPPGCPGEVERLSRITGSGQEACTCDR